MSQFEQIDKPAIELESRRLIRDVWRHHTFSLADRFAVLDPRLACKQLGLAYEPHPNLPWFSSGRVTDVAGIFDRAERRVLVAQMYGPVLERFTAAHEIGHFLMHPNAVMHREVPDFEAKPKDEREANYFSACFLIPANLLREEFEMRFGSPDTFSFDESSGCWLTPRDPESLVGEGLWDERALAIATSTLFSGHSFESLCDRFRVSRTAMRIRLVETEIVRG